jgi:hypothetical protein
MGIRQYPWNIGMAPKDRLILLLGALLLASGCAEKHI